MIHNSYANKNIGNFFVDANTIIRCQASSNYTKIFFSNQQPIVLAKTLSLCAAALSNNNFIRIHQSHLINKNYVKHIAVNGTVFLQDGTICKISRRKKTAVKELLFAS
jgi:two-component system, LytTR family, response regulator